MRRARERKIDRIILVPAARTLTAAPTPALDARRSTLDSAGQTANRTTGAATADTAGGEDVLVPRSGMCAALMSERAPPRAALHRISDTAPAGARLIFFAGTCPLDLDGSTVGVGDYAAQAGKAMENLALALKAAGVQLENVLSTRVLVASSTQSDLVEAWTVIREAFGEHDVPSTLLGVTVLGYTDQLVEIEAVAAVID